MSVSLLGKIAANSPYTDQVVICLLTATHPALGADAFRLTSDTKQTISRGDTFEPFQFDIVLVDQQGEGQPRGLLRVSTIGIPNPGSGPKSVVEVIRSIQAVDGPIKVKLEFVLSDSLDTLMMDAFDDLEWRDVTYNAQVAEGPLIGPGRLSEGLQSTLRRFTPLTTPGVFAQ